MKSILSLEKQAGRYEEKNNNGWLVGYVETETRNYYYATNISPKENFKMENFARIRYKLTIEAFQKLNLIN